MRRLSLIMALSAFAFPAFAQIPEGLPQNLAAYRDKDTVLELMRDSRAVRTLKSAPESVRKDFIETLTKQVYAQVDQAVLNKVGAMDKYQGKRLVMHDFRTPGSDPASINADRDTRLLVEAEPGRWVEVPRKTWEADFYEEFGKVTGKPANTSAVEHAGKYRQLATDKYHREASLDYTDQTSEVRTTRNADGTTTRQVIRSSTIQQARAADGSLMWEADGRPVFVSDTAIQAAKHAGKDVQAYGIQHRATLRDAEGLARMYHEKGGDQLRAAQADGLSPDARAMHQAEAAVQVGKGVKSLNALRESYELQGYRVGAPSDNFAAAADLVSKQTGDFKANPAALDADLKKLGFTDGLRGFNEALSAQMESLKLARLPSPPPPPSAMESFVHGKPRAGFVAGAAVAAAIDLIHTAEQIRAGAKDGSHLYVALDQDDGFFTENAKVYGMALLESTGVPGLMEVGFQADIKEQKRIENAIRRGEVVDPLISTARVFTEVTTEAVKGIIVTPIASIHGLGEEILGLAAARAGEAGSLAASQRQDRAAATAKDQRLTRESAFDLGLVRKWLGAPGGERLTGPVPDGSSVSFSVDRSERWNDAYQVEWQVSGRPKAGKKVPADDPQAHVLSLSIRDWPVGTHTVILTVRGVADGKVYGQERESFEISRDVGIGSMSVQEGGWDGARVSGPVKKGGYIAASAAPLGAWSKAHRIQWMVGGTIYQDKPGDDSAATRVRFSTEDIGGDGFTLALRVTDAASGKVIAHRSVEVAFARAVAASSKDFKIVATTGDYGGPALSAPVPNGTILAFESTIVYPPGETAPVTTLVWQVIDSTGTPRADLTKREQVAEAGTTHTHRYKIRPSNLPNGAYKVVLTRQSSAEGARAEQAEVPLRIFQPVRIDRLVVATDAEASAHTGTMMADQAPHLFVYYDADGLREVNVDLIVRDAANGAEYGRQTVSRPIKPGSDEQRVGLRLEPGQVPTGREAVFVATIGTPDGSSVRKETNFTVRDYSVGIVFAQSSARSSEPVTFSLSAPDSFTLPFRVALSSDGGTADMMGDTRGQMIPMLSSGQTSGTAGLSVILTDAQGRRASGYASLSVSAPPPPPPPVVAAPAPTYTPVPVQQAPEPPPPAETGINLDDAIAKFNRQMAQIQADKQNAEYERNLHNQQEMQKLQMQLQQQQQQQRAAPSTIYWVVYTEDVCGAVGCPSVSITSGPRPPPTGFSNPTPSSPGNYMRVTKAYGTLDMQEAQRIEAGIRSRSLSTSDYFPVTFRGPNGYQGAGHSGPLVRYGPGVQALVR